MNTRRSAITPPFSSRSAISMAPSPFGMTTAVASASGPGASKSWRSQTATDATSKKPRNANDSVPSRKRRKPFMRRGSRSALRRLGGDGGRVGTRSSDGLRGIGAAPVRTGGGSRDSCRSWAGAGRGFIEAVPFLTRRAACPAPMRALPAESPDSSLVRTLPVNMAEAGTIASAGAPVGQEGAGPLRPRSASGSARHWCRRSRTSSRAPCRSASGGPRAARGRSPSRPKGCRD